MKIKFYVWFSIVALVQASAMVLGALASGGTGLMVLFSIVCSVAFAYGLVGIAIGLGALYSRFDWEHLSQLAVGYGNIIFMLLGAFWVLVHFYPVWLIISLPGDMFRFERILLVCGLIIFDSIVQRVCLKRGMTGLQGHIA